MAAPFRSVVLGVDGSPHARRAVAFLARLLPRPRGRVTVVRVVEPVRLPSMGLLPTPARGRLAGVMAHLERSRRAGAEKSCEAARAALTRAGWRVTTSVRTGVPIEELLAAADETGADLLALGARGTGGLERLLLGSVAEGALRRAAIPVLLVP